MTHKQIEASREARLWIKNVLIPLISVAGLVLLNKDVRKGIATKIDELKKQPEIIVVEND